jgi:hypothetical protein
VAKVLASRLAKVLEDLIPKTQSAFLKGRNLVEGVMVVNEVTDFAKKTRKKCLIFKVDFEKAYDSVDWGFLDYMHGRFGFNSKWRAWMRACVCSGSMSVLLNGSPTEEINIKRGLKQGDPLAPLLFLIVAEGLVVLCGKRWREVCSLLFMWVGVVCRFRCYNMRTILYVLVKQRWRTCGL